MRLFLSAATVVVGLAQYAAGLASTDSIRDADVGQSSYLPYHNMDPAVVNSAQFGQLWKIAFNRLEQVGYTDRLSMSLLPKSNGWSDFD